MLWTMHHKASGGQDDEFRRAVEAIRLTGDTDACLAANPTHVEYVILGDMNDDVDDFQNVQFKSLPSGLPGSYQLGCDIAFPVPYAVFPENVYECSSKCRCWMLSTRTPWRTGPTG